MINIGQKVGVVEDPKVNQELDFLHERLNQLGIVEPKCIQDDYQARVEDSYIAVDRAGVSVTMPKLSTRQKFTIRIRDHSGKAGTTPITIFLGTGVELDGSTANPTISTNYGSFLLFWDGSEFRDLT